MKIARLSIAVAVFALVPAALFAQSTIQGVVSDSSGAVIANATVVASSDVLIEKSRTVRTNGDGRYAIVDLRPGSYIVTATAPGFDTVRAGLEIPANVSVPYDATLRPGSVGETVTVEARAATVDTENVAHPETLSRTEMDALPTARYMQAMAVYVPGAHLNLPDVGGSQQIEQNYISVHGNGSVHDTYMLDGLLVNTTYSDGQIQQYIDNAAIQESTKYATEVPFRTMQHSLDVFEIIKAMAEHGNPNSVSDAGVGALCVRSAVMGAFLNVKINAAGLKDRTFADDILARGAEIERQAIQKESEIMTIVNKKIDS